MAPYKPKEHAEARRLRREFGTPIKQIASQLSVSPSTASLWVRDIELTEEQRIRNHRLAGVRRGRTWAEVNRERRRGYQEEGRAQARMKDPLHQAGCMLYWAEGSKDRNQFCFANSDVHMVRFIRTFVSEVFERPPEDFAVSLNVYTDNGLTVREIEDHWLRALDLPRTCLRAHSLNHLPTSSSGRKRFKLPYGVCDLRVLRSTPIVQHIYGAIQEYGGFEEPMWLDGPPRRRPPPVSK